MYRKSNLVKDYLRLILSDLSEDYIQRYQLLSFYTERRKAFNNIYVMKEERI